MQIIVKPEVVNDVGGEIIYPKITIIPSKGNQTEDDDDSVVVLADVGEIMQTIVNDAVVIDAKPTQQSADATERSPLGDFLQNLFQGPGAAEVPYSRDPPDNCPKCSWVNIFI